MGVARRAVAGLAASLLGLMTLAAEPARAVERTTVARAMLKAGPAGPPSHLAPEADGLAPQRAQAASFEVTYRGFSAAARAAFERALAVWSRRLDSPVPITVLAVAERVPAGFLALAGPAFIWRDFEGAPDPSTWYADALANKLAGEQLDPDTPDIVASFDLRSDWHFGSGPAPAGKYDFTTVCLHEIGHGLGFLSFADILGGKGLVRIFGHPGAYDRFVENAAGQSLVRDFRTRSRQLAGQLQGGSLFFDSSIARSASGGDPPRLHAPRPFQPASSISHLDEAAYPAGNPDSLMTPALGRGETIRRTGPIALAVLRTIGW